MVPDRGGKVKSYLYRITITETNKLSTSGYSSSITLRKSIADGDRLCVLYKGANETEWIQAKRSSDGVIDEILLCVDANDMAKNAAIEYCISIASGGTPYTFTLAL